MTHVSDRFVNYHRSEISDSYETLAWLRSNMPVAQVMSASEGQAWLVTSYELARACLADPRLKNNRIFSRREIQDTPYMWPQGAAPEGDLLGIDPPDHTRLRRLLHPIFSPGASRQNVSVITNVCTTLLDSFAKRGCADLAAEFATPLAWSVIHETLGIPETQRMSVSLYTDRFLIAVYADHDPEMGTAAYHEIMTYIRKLIEYKKSHRGADGVTLLIQDVEQGTLNSAELEGLLYMLIGAGQITTGPMIAGAILRLLRNPDQLAKMLTGKLAWRLAVEEALRCDSPLQTSVRRYATTDMEIGDTRISKGDAVMVSFAAANRDPNRFSCPESFQVSSKPMSHLGFGHGVHLCVGAPLARLQGEIALSLLFERLPSLRLAVPPEQIPWTLVPRSDLGKRAVGVGPLPLRGPAEVPVRFEADSADT